MKKLAYLIMALALALGLTLPVATPVLADSTVFKFPTNYATGTTPGDPVKSPEAALVDDVATGQQDPGSFGQPKTALFSQDGDPFSSSEFYYGFGFGIPSGAAIDGIEVVVSGYCEGSEGFDSPLTFSIGLSGDTGVSWTGYQETSPRLVYTDTEYTLGGPADLWGKAWNAGSFSDGNFRLEVVATHHGHSSWVALDSVRVKVYYTPTSTIMKSFSINKMTVDFGRQDDRDSINMKASFVLPDGVSFNPAKDAVKFNIDGFAIDIPAGSFKGNKNESKYTYDSARGVEPKISVNLDFKKGEVVLVIKKANVDVINSSDGVAVSFSIGSSVGTQNLNMYIDALTYPKQR